MFSSLESNWGNSAHRERATLASFGFQAMALSLLLLIPLLTIQGPPKLEWFCTLPVPAPPPAAGPPETRRGPVRSSNIRQGQIQEPERIPDAVAILNEQTVESSPDVSGLGVEGGIGTRGRGVLRSVGPAVEVVPPPPPASTHPLKVSYWAEGNLIFRVQPLYPALARQARIQGSVELRAIISKAGTIENLVVVGGHPLLVKAAIDAVRQWRYRPYLLNGDPVEVETEVTVNFLLAGG